MVAQASSGSFALGSGEDPKPVLLTLHFHPFPLSCPHSFGQPKSLTTDSETHFSCMQNTSSSSSVRCKYLCQCRPQGDHFRITPLVGKGENPQSKTGSHIPTVWKGVLNSLPPQSLNSLNLLGEKSFGHEQHRKYQHGFGKALHALHTPHSPIQQHLH